MNKIKAKLKWINQALFIQIAFLTKNEFSSAFDLDIDILMCNELSDEYREWVLKNRIKMHNLTLI